MSTFNTAAFKAYDIRGRLPDELNVDLAYRIGRAYAEYLQPTRVVVGYDIRLSSPELAAAVSQGLIDGGSEVLDLGMVGTEEVYFATFHLQTDGGIMVTASHNPKEYNAYYQEAVDRVDKLIDSKSEETKDFILKTILKDKNLDIIFKFSELHWFLDNISLKYRNKLLKRLYGYIINKLEGRI